MQLWRHAPIRIVLWSSIVCLAAGLGGLGCSSDPIPAPTFEFELFGWTPHDGNNPRFVRKLRDYPGVETVNIQMTRPRIDDSGRRGSVRSQSMQDVTADGARLPELSFGSDLRFGFDLRNADDEIVASGATPLFDSNVQSSNKQFRVMLSPVREFTPVGARFRPEDKSSSRDWTYQPVAFDGPVEADLGRIGHVATPLGDGRVLVTGGGQLAGSGPGHPSNTPKMSRVFRELQIFNPEDGYVTNISFENRQDNPDRLLTGHAYHDVVQVSEQRFIVTGGLNRQDGETEPTRAIEVVDLSRDPGNRVDVVNDEAGQPLALSKARFHHTATYLESTRQIVVVGGVGAGGDGDILSSVEVIDLESREVRTVAQLETARAEHATVTIQDSSEGSALWVIGGRSAESALSSTEVVQLQSGGAQINTGGSMSQARYDMAIERIPVRPSSVAVIGGFTSIEDEGGAPTRLSEFGVIPERTWPDGSALQLEHARGGAHAFKLTQSDHIVVIGGRGPGGERAFVPEAEWLLANFEESPPFEVQGNVGTMYQARYQTTATHLNNGMILLTGGYGRSPDGPQALETLSYYNPGDIVGQQ